MRTTIPALALLVTLAAPLPAPAGLHIKPNFLGQGAPPAPELIAGGGDLQEIFATAAKAWERLFRKGGDKWVVRIDFDWDTPGNRIDFNLFGQEFNEEEGGTPLRITHSTILFANIPPKFTDEDLGWFADPTPKDNSEYLSYESDVADVGNGSMNVGRVFSDARGAAVKRIDLLTIAMHEIGHALGLDDEYEGFLHQHLEGLYIPITSPRPHPGIRILTFTGQSHLAGVIRLDEDQVSSNQLLMFIQTRTGIRQLISGADALAVAQISSYKRPTLPKR